MGEFPWALSIVMGSISFSHFVSISVSFPPSLSIAAPRARQNVLQPAWQLHNAFSFPPALFFCAFPLPFPVLLLGFPG